MRDLDLTRGVVVISRSATESHGAIDVKSTKSGKGCEVPLPTILRDQLRDHLNDTGRRVAPDKLVFQTRRGHQIRPSTYRNRTLAHASKGAGLER